MQTLPEERAAIQANEHSWEPTPSVEESVRGGRYGGGAPSETSTRLAHLDGEIARRLLLTRASRGRLKSGAGPAEGGQDEVEGTRRVNQLSHTWNGLLVLASGWSCLEAPYRLAFTSASDGGATRPTTGLTIAACVIDGLFITNLCRSLLPWRTLLAHAPSPLQRWFPPEPASLADFSTSLRDYAMSGQLALDFLSAFPWDVMAESGGASRGTQFGLGMLRLLRLQRVSDWFTSVETDVRSRYWATRLFKLLLLLLFHCHFFACLFYLVATEEGRYESNWFAVTQAAKPGHGSADTLARWLFAYYWAIVTFATIGYGDIVPVSNRECVHCWQCMACTYGGSLRRIQYIVTIVFILLNLFLSALIVGNVTSLVLLMAEKRRVYRQRHGELLKYSRIHGLPDAVREEMSSYLVLRFNAQEARAPDVLHDLPPLLRSRVARHLHLPVIAASPLFAGCSDGFVDHIATNLSFDLYMPGVDLMASGEVGSAELCLLVSGSAAVLAPRPEAEEDDDASADDGVLVAVSKLSAAGESFGEIPFLFSLPQPFTIRSTSLCRVLSLKSSAWAAAAAAHPRDAHTASLNVRAALSAALARPDAPVALRAVIDPLLGGVSAALAARDAERVSEMCFAAARNDVLSIRRSLAAGATVNGADYDARVPLHVAAAKGAEAAVSYLLDRGAAPNAMDNFGFTPLLEAALGGHATVAAMLRNSGAVLGLQEAASVDAHKRPPQLVARRVKDAGTMLCGAASAGDLQLLTALLSNGLSARSTDYNKRSALHLAAAFGRTQVLALLLQEGADPNAVDAFGRSPLLEAVRGGHEAEAELLMEAGARLGLGSGGEAGDHNELLAGGEMCAAAACGDTEYLRRLLRFGCPPDAADYDARSAAHLACAEGMRSVVLLLLEHGANFHALDRWGHTPLWEAERNGHAQIAATVRVLQPIAPTEVVAVPRPAPAAAAKPAPPPPPARDDGPPSPGRAAAEEVGSEAAQALAGSAEELASAGGGGDGGDGSLLGEVPKRTSGEWERREVGRAKSERLGPWLAQSGSAKE